MLGGTIIHLHPPPTGEMDQEWTDMQPRFMMAAAEALDHAAEADRHRVPRACG